MCMNKKGFIPIFVLFIASIIMAGATIGVIAFKNEVKVENLSTNVQTTITEVPSTPLPITEPIITETPTKPLKTPITATIVNPVQPETTPQIIIPPIVIETPQETPINEPTIVIEPFVREEPTPEPTPMPAPTQLSEPTPEPPKAEEPVIPTLTATATIQSIPDTVVSIKFSIVNTGQDILKINTLRFRLDSYDKRINVLTISGDIQFPNGTDNMRYYGIGEVKNVDGIFDITIPSTYRMDKNNASAKPTTTLINELQPGELAYIRFGIGMPESFPSDGEQFKFILEPMADSIEGKTAGNDSSYSNVELKSMLKVQE